MLTRHAVHIVLALAVALVGLPSWAAPARAATVPPSEWAIGPLDRVAIITFDGQARARHLEGVLEALRGKRAKASFFMSGEWISSHPRKGRLVTQARHSLGNRGWGKTPFTELSDAALRSSIARSADALNEVGAYPAPFLRAPKGARDLRVLRVAGSMGYRSVYWTHHPGGGLAKRVQRAVVRRARAGSIISLDLWRRSHRKALPGIVDGLRRRGFSLGKIDRLANVHAVRWDVTLRQGSSGAEVTYLQKALRFTSYPVGGVDGSFGEETTQAVYAFEKVHRLARDGVVPPWQMSAIAAGRRPRAPKRDPKNFVDIDISRQVLFEVRDRKVVHTIPISSGNEEYYTVDGQTYRAHTPRGSYSIYRKVAGTRVSRLGELYNPSYFVGGYAIHGSKSVPTYPASHGCVRIPMYVHRAFFYRNPIGMPVFVHD